MPESNGISVGYSCGNRCILYADSHRILFRLIFFPVICNSDVKGSDSVDGFSLFVTILTAQVFVKFSLFGDTSTTQEILIFLGHISSFRNTIFRHEARQYNVPDLFYPTPQPAVPHKGKAGVIAKVKPQNIAQANVFLDQRSNSPVLNRIKADTFKLSKDGTEVFTGEDQILGESTIVTCKVTNEQLGLDKNAFVDAGNYKIDFYMKGDAGDELLDTVSVTVEKTPPKQNNGGNNNSGALPGEGNYFTFRNAQFRQHVKACGWLNNDNCKTSANTYKKDVKKLTFSIQVDDLNMAEVDYKYFYSDKTDTDSLKNAMKEPVFSGSAKPKQFTEGIFYDFDYQVDQAKLGIYLVGIYEKGTNNLICLAYVGVS